MEVGYSSSLSTLNRDKLGDLGKALAGGYESENANKLERRIGDINDNTQISDSERLDELKPLFALLDIELEFHPNE